MKKFIFFLIFILSKLGFSQAYKNLDVRLESQKASNLCWAAAIQMVAKYHGINQDQCAIRGIRYDIESPDYRATGVDSCNFYNCNNTTFGDQDNQIWNSPLQMFNGKNETKNDIIFSKMGFYSIEDTRRLTLSIIKNQIDRCRPYIMNITEGTEDNTNHAVVVKGYFANNNSFISSTNRFVIVNDPWGEKPCEGKSYYLRILPNMIFDTLRSGAADSFLITANSFVHDIRKKAEVNCNCNNRPIIKADMVNIIPRPAAITHSWASVSTTAFAAMKTPRHPILVHYLSEKQLLNANSAATLTLENVKLNHQVIDVVYTGVLPFSIYTYERQGTNWENIRIENNHYPQMVNCVLDIPTHDEVTLSYRKDIHGTIPYEYVKYIPYFERFYKFTHNNMSYLVPRMDYNYPDGTVLKANIAYAESLVLQILSKATKAVK